jgi:hypothetical protein
MFTSICESPIRPLLPVPAGPLEFLKNASQVLAFVPILQELDLSQNVLNSVLMPITRETVLPSRCCRREPHPFLQRLTKKLSLEMIHRKYKKKIKQEKN